MIGRLARGRLLKATPYGRLVSLGWVVLSRLREDVSPADRARLTQILRTNARNPRAITAADRAELRRILSSVDIKRLGREAALAQTPFGPGGGGGSGRRPGLPAGGGGLLSRFLGRR